MLRELELLPLWKLRAQPALAEMIDDVKNSKPAGLAGITSQGIC